MCPCHQIIADIRVCDPTDAYYLVCTDPCSTTSHSSIRTGDGTSRIHQHGGGQRDGGRYFRTISGPKPTRKQQEK
jgi:hypothetical protein